MQRKRGEQLQAVGARLKKSTVALLKKSAEGFGCTLSQYVRRQLEISVGERK